MKEAYIVIAGTSRPLWLEAYPTAEEADAAAREAWAKMRDRTRCCYPVHIVRVERDTLCRTAFHDDGTVDWCDFPEGAGDPCPDLFDGSRFDLRGHVYMAIEETDTDGTLSVFDSPKEAADEASGIWCRLTPAERKRTRVRSFKVLRENLRADLGAFERFDDDGTVDWAAYDEETPYPGDFDSARAERIAELASDVSDALYDADLTWSDVFSDFDGSLALPDRVSDLCRAICETAGEIYLLKWETASPYNRFTVTDAAAEMYAVTID